MTAPIEVERPSVYLIEKAVSLGRALDFFLAKGNNVRTPADKKRIVFLCQIDFWEWEIDSLIYCFENFKERAKVWTGELNQSEALARNGLSVKSKYINNFRWSNANKIYSCRREKGRTVAPFEMLNEVIAKWNELIGICDGYYNSHAENAIKLGAQLKPNLQGYKKKPVEETGE